MRGGTENIAGIVGLAKAMELTYEDITAHQKHIQELKNYMIDQLKIQFSDITFHGETKPEESLYTVLNVCFPKTEKSGMLLFTLDLKGVAVSGGSACSSRITTMVSSHPRCMSFAQLRTRDTASMGLAVRFRIWCRAWRPNPGMKRPNDAKVYRYATD